MPRTLEVFEHGKLDVSDHGLRQTEFEALVRFNDEHAGRYFDVGHKHLKAKSFVGYVEVGEVCIEILPKADRDSTSSKKVWRDGMLEMLRVALGLRIEQLPTAAQNVTRSRLLDLIARAYLAELERLLHEGLAKGYRTTSSNGGVFRGRLKMAEHLRANIARHDRFFVEYQTFDHDIDVNRVLVAALDALSCCALSSSVACAVDSCLGRIPEVQNGGVTVGTFDRIRLARSTQRYAAALVYARMILAQQGPRLRVGRARVFALLFDMNALWERYVAVLLRRVAPPELEICSQERHLFWTPGERGIRVVKPDIVVRSRPSCGRGQVRLVIDTKWKVPPKGLPSDDDLKQMFVYNELLSGGRSILLYPRTSESVAASGPYATKAHTCEQRHLGLFEGETWSSAAIKDQLAALVGIGL